MTEKFISAPVPFVPIGNRRGLTMQQIKSDPALEDFYRRFSSSFETHALNTDVVLFIEPPQEPPAKPVRPGWTKKQRPAK